MKRLHHQAAMQMWHRLPAGDPCQHGRRGPCRGGHPRRGFTLIELLVGLAIIIFLTALLFPAIKNILQKSQSTSCQSNLRQIGSALHAYATDHNGILVDAAAVRRNVSKDDLGDYWYGALQPYVDGTFLASNRLPRPKWQLCPAKKLRVKPTSTTDAAYAEAVIGYGWVYQKFRKKDGSYTGGFGQVTQNISPGSKDPDDPGVNTRLVEVEKPADTIIVGDSRDEDTTDNYHQSRYLYKDETYTKFAQRHSGGGNYLFVDGHVEWMTPDQLKARLPGVFMTHKDP